LRIVRTAGSAPWIGSRQSSHVIRAAGSCGKLWCRIIIVRNPGCRANLTVRKKLRVAKLCPVVLPEWLPGFRRIVDRIAKGALAGVRSPSSTSGRQVLLAVAHPQGRSRPAAKQTCNQTLCNGRCFELLSAGVSEKRVTEDAEPQQERPTCW
jgi:hypothetical protein